MRTVQLPNIVLSLGKVGFGRISGIVPVLLLALALGAVGINQPLHIDEAYSVMVTDNGFIDILKNLNSSAHPPAYMFVISIWRSLFGASEAAIRSLSLAFYLLTIYSLYRLGRHFYSQPTAVIGALLYAISPLAIAQAKFARPYTLLTFACVLSTFFIFKIGRAKQPSTSSFFYYFAFVVLGTFTHYWFFFVLAAHGMLWLFEYRMAHWRKVIPVVALALVPFVVFWLPVLATQVSQNAASWLKPPGAIDFFSTILAYYGDADAVLLYALFLFLVFLRIELRQGFLPKIYFKLPEIDSSRKEIAQLLLLVFVMLLTPIIVSQFKPLFFVRYTIIALFAVSLILSILLTRYAQPLILYPTIVILASAVFVLELRSKHVEPDNSSKNLVKFIVENAKKGDTILATSLSLPGLHCYLKKSSQFENFQMNIFPKELEEHPAWRHQDVDSKRREILEREALSLSSELLLEAKNSSVWLIYGYDLEVSNPILNNLTEKFPYRKVHQVAGDWSTSVIEFKKHSLAALND